MVVLQEKGIQQYFWDLILQSAVYNNIRKKTIIPIQETKIEHVEIASVPQDRKSVVVHLQ